MNIICSHFAVNLSGPKLEILSERQPRAADHQDVRRGWISLPLTCGCVLAAPAPARDEIFAGKSSRSIRESKSPIECSLVSLRAEGIAGPSPASAGLARCLRRSWCSSEPPRRFQARSVLDTGRSVARYFSGQMSRPGGAWPSSLRGGLPGISPHPRSPGVPAMGIARRAATGLPPPARRRSA
jgi:hypothetical protein